MEMLKMPGGRKITGWDARFAVSNDGPMQFLYPKESFMGVYFTGNTLDLQTDAARPGLIALHVTSHGDSPDNIVGEHTFWIDPAHADRPVHEEETYYRDPKVHTLSSRRTTDFADYFQLPDGRWLPGTSTNTQQFPSLHEIQKRTFHFFPGRTLPPLPPPTGAVLP